MELFKKYFNVRTCRTLQGDMPMPSDLQLVYIVPRNPTQLLNIHTDTTKFQMECEQVYYNITTETHPALEICSTISTGRP